MSAHTKRQAGFTLIEVLVALAILSVAVVASIQGFAQGLRLLKLSGDHQHAMLLADQKVREVVEFKEGREDGTDGRLRWERIVRPLDAPDLAPPGRPPSGRVFEVDVRVSWDPQRQVEIRTLRMVPTENIEATLPAGQGTLPGPQGTQGTLGTKPSPTSPGSRSPGTTLPGLSGSGGSPLGRGTQSPFGGGR